MEFLRAFFGTAGFLPHGYCFTWTPVVLWSMVGADAVIATAYFSIPAAILSFVRQRSDPRIYGVAFLFSAFIFSCGITHVMDVWTIWHPDYGLQALTKTATAAVSIVTAFALWPLIPAMLKLPSVHALQSAIASLQAEIAKRQVAEDEVVDIQQSLAVALASIGAGFIATDRAGRVTRMNVVAEGITGWTQNEATGQDIWRVFEREGRPADYVSRNAVDVMIEQGFTVDVVHRIVVVSRDGRRTVVEVQSDLTRAADGAVLGMAMVFRDMTVVAGTEAELSRLAAIVASSNDAIIGKTLDGRITSWNRAAESLFGYSAEEAVGQPVQMLIPPERQAEEMHIIAQVAQGQSVSAFDTVRLNRDGHALDLSITISPILDGAGRVVGASKIARDVSVQRQAEDARRKAQRLEAENRQIQEANRLKSQFLANMSHELRTPLNAVIGFADLLHSGYVKPESPQHREFLGHIATSGRHLLQLINDVLDLSKVESGKFDFFAAPLDLRAVFKEVNDILHTAIQRKNITIRTEIDPDLSALTLDAGRLKQVLYNYLSNAIKFTASGGTVTVSAAGEGPAHFRIEVGDNGIGIAPADLPLLFSEFQQLDAGYSKQHQGTGLGLALTRRLVEAQGGHVGVRSTVGVGSVFYLVLNRTHGDDLAAGQDAAAEVSRVLVIEDDQREQARMMGAFETAGFEVDAASDGPHAIRQARDTAYAALTLNLRLADQRGFDLLSNIRSHGASHASPVVGMTLPADPDTTAAFAIANVLCKPIRSDEILAAMTRFKLPKAERANVIVIDDEQASLDLMRATLKSIGLDAVCFLDGRVALQQIDHLRPDAIVLDLMMPEFDGFQVLDALQRLPTWCDVPVFIWTSMLLTEEEYASLAKSARAIVIKGGGAMDGMIESLRRWRQPV